MPVDPPPLIDKFEAPGPVRDKYPDKSLIVSGVSRLMVLPVRLLSNVIWSSPTFVDAMAIASLSEPLPELLVLVTRMGATDGVKSVPLTVRLAVKPKYLPPVIKVRFVGHEIGAETLIFPAVLLPIVSVLAVIWLSSVWERPRLDALSAPPRSTPAPIVWISTLPADVAFTVPVRVILLAVRVICPPLE